MSSRASYNDAIEWIGRNDDNLWLNDDNPATSVTAALVADLFCRDDKAVIADLIRECKRLKTCSSRSWREDRKTKA